MQFIFDWQFQKCVEVTVSPVFAVPFSSEPCHLREMCKFDFGLCNMTYISVHLLKLYICGPGSGCVTKSGGQACRLLNKLNYSRWTNNRMVSAWNVLLGLVQADTKVVFEALRWARGYRGIMILSRQKRLV